MKTSVTSYFFNSLRFRLYLLFSSAVIVVALSIIYYFPQQFESQAFSAARSKTVTITAIAAYSAAPFLFYDDHDGLDEVLTSAHKNTDLKFMLVTDREGSVVIDYNSESALQSNYKEADRHGVLSADRSTIMAESDIVFQDSVIGRLYVGLSLEGINAEVKRSRTNIIIGSILILVIGLMIVYFAVTLLIKPLEMMVRSFQQIATGDLTKRAESSAYSEINRLSESFNQMVSTVATVQEELQSVNRTLEQRVDERTNDLRRVIQRQHLTEEALRESEERYRALVDLSPDAIAVHSAEKFLFINQSVLTMFRVQSTEEMLNRSLFEFMKPVHLKQFKSSLEELLNGKKQNMLSEYSFVLDDDSEFHAEMAVTKLEFRGTAAVQIVIRDITARIKNERHRMELEQQLLHVQKKEIVSTLASGLAHDILNILGIIGTSINKLLFMKNLTHESLMESAEQISKASERGKTLVRQLLTFAQKSALNFDSININEIIMEIVLVIERTFPSTITIETHLAENLPLVRADQNQLHQALLNLSLNARDAVQGNGTITIESVLVDNPDDASIDVQHRQCICVVVSDNGIGMSEDVQKHIFEPFFTTKSKGTGSGLGMAMVKGIMENHGGLIRLESAEGKGTAIRLYFPV